MGRGTSETPAQLTQDRGRAGKRYRLMTENGFVWSDTPGRFGGITTMGIFGRLDCKSGMRAKPGNRIFFSSWEDAIACGYRPCKNCKPLPGDDYCRYENGWQPAAPIAMPFDLDALYPVVGAGSSMADAATTMNEQGSGVADCAGYNFDYDFQAGAPLPTFRQVLAAGEAERRALYGFLADHSGLAPFRHETADQAQRLLRSVGLESGEIEIFAHADDAEDDPDGYTWLLGGGASGGVSLGITGAIVIGADDLGEIERWLESGEAGEMTFDALVTVLHEAIHQASPDPGRAFGTEAEEAEETVIEALSRALAPRYVAELAAAHGHEVPAAAYHVYNNLEQKHPEVFALKERELVQLVKLWAHQRPAALAHLGWTFS